MTVFSAAAALQPLLLLLPPPTANFRSRSTTASALFHARAAGDPARLLRDLLRVPGMGVPRPSQQPRGLQGQSALHGRSSRLGESERENARPDSFR